MLLGIMVICVCATSLDASEFENRYKKGYIVVRHRINIKI